MAFECLHRPSFKYWIIMKFSIVKWILFKLNSNEIDYYYKMQFLQQFLWWHRTWFTMYNIVMYISEYLEVVEHEKQFFQCSFMAILHSDDVTMPIVRWRQCSIKGTLWLRSESSKEKKRKGKTWIKFLAFVSI